MLPHDGRVVNDAIGRQLDVAVRIPRPMPGRLGVRDIPPANDHHHSLGTTRRVR